MRVIICEDTPFYLLPFPEGTSDIQLLTLTPGIEYDPENNSIKFTWGDLTLGVYGVVISGVSGDETIVLNIEFVVVDCEPKPILDTFTLCIKDSNYNIQLQINNGVLYDDFFSDDLPERVSLSPTGVITFAGDDFGEPFSFTAKYGSGLEALITINPIVCQPPTKISITECEADGIGICWVNQEGGRQSFYFNQPKEFAISQEDGQTYVNQSNEKRYYTKGLVEDVVRITQQFIPIEFVTSINSLKNAIQAWTFTDIDNKTTYKSIVIDEDSWNFKRTKQRFYELSFNFKYSVAKIIQRQ